MPIPTYSRDILFDTSAINIPLDQPEILKQLIYALKLGNFRLLISENILYESFSHRHNVVRRKKHLDHLLSLGDKTIDVIAHSKVLCRKEQRGQIESIPLIPRTEKAALLKFIDDIQKDPSICDSVLRTISSWKENAYKHDVNAQTFGRLSNRIAIQNVDLMLQKLSLSNIPKWLEKSFCREFLKNKFKAGCIVNAPSGRMLAGKAWLSLAYLTMHGNIFPDMYGSRIAQITRPDRCNWYDNAIGSLAAYCRYLIVEDKALRDRCNFLRKRKIVHFESLSLREYLDISHK